MKSIKFITIILFTLLISHTGFSQKQNNINPPKLIAVKFHADWCRVCRAMGPVFEDLQNKMDGSDVLFIKLDFTNNKTKNQANLLGAELGLANILKRNYRKTGFILVIDAKTKKVLKKLTINDDLLSMETKIRAFL